MIAIVFSSHARFLDYAEDNMRHDPSGLYGYPDPKQYAVFLPADSVRTLRHETVHWVVIRSNPVHAVQSPWLSEGLAQLFEFGELRGNLRIPKVTREHLIGPLPALHHFDRLRYLLGKKIKGHRILADHGFGHLSDRLG